MNPYVTWLHRPYTWSPSPAFRDPGKETTDDSGRQDGGIWRLYITSLYQRGAIYAVSTQINYHGKIWLNSSPSLLFEAPNSPYNAWRMRPLASLHLFTVWAPIRNSCFSFWLKYFAVWFTDIHKIFLSVVPLFYSANFSSDGRPELPHPRSTTSKLQQLYSRKMNWKVVNYTAFEQAHSRI